MKPKIHVVVHVRSASQACGQVIAAVDAGVDGVWLIDHAGDHRDLLSLTRLVRGSLPSLWLGVNYLDLSVDRASALVDDGVNGLWSDNAHVHLDDDHEIAERARALRSAREWDGLYFGGVAFKGQRIETDLEGAVERAVPYVDVLTTSGTATGVAAPEEKIRRMHAALGGRRPLAVASGITPENVESYLPYVDYLMVNTGVSRNFYELDPDKLARLVEAVRSWPR